MAEYKIDLSDEDIARIAALARERDVSAETIIKQAIATEKLIADNVGAKDELQVKRGDTVTPFNFQDSAR